MTIDGRQIRPARDGVRAVGFAHVELREPGSAHPTEPDVHPDHGQRGLGRRLVQAVCAWAAVTRYDAVTLTSFRDLPWNMPCYHRTGFEEIPAADVSLTLAAILRHEGDQGIDPARRVGMRWSSATDATRSTTPATSTPTPQLARDR